MSTRRIKKSIGKKRSVPDGRRCATKETRSLPFPLLKIKEINEICRARPIVYIVLSIFLEEGGECFLVSSNPLMLRLIEFSPFLFLLQRQRWRRPIKRKEALCPFLPLPTCFGYIYRQLRCTIASYFLDFFSFLLRALEVRNSARCHC